MHYLKIKDFQLIKLHLQQVVYPTNRDVTYDVTKKNAQGCQAGTRWILDLETLVHNMSK